MRHLTSKELSAHLDGVVQSELVRLHLDDCEQCRGACVRMASAEDALAALITHDPDDRFFEALEGFLEVQLNAKGAADPLPPELESLLGEEIVRLESHRWAALSEAVPRTLLGPATAARPVPMAETAGPIPLEASDRDPAGEVRTVDPATPGAEAESPVAPAPGAPPWESRRRKRGRPATHRPSTTSTSHAVHHPPLEPAASAAKSAAAPDAIASTPAVPMLPAAAVRPLQHKAPMREPSPSQSAASRGTRSSTRPGGGGRIIGLAVVVLVLLLAGLYLNRRGTLPDLMRGKPRPGDSSVSTGAATAGAAGGVVAGAAETLPAAPPVAPVAKPSTAAATPPPEPKRPTAPSPEAPRSVAPRSAAPGSVAPRPVPARPAAEPGILCGQIRDESGKPVVRAQVLLADLHVGALTDGHGRFCISVPFGSRTVSVIALGFTTQRRVVTVEKTTAEIAITLRSEAVQESTRDGGP